MVKAGLRIVALFAVVMVIAACSGKPTEEDPNIQFEITGDREVQIWSSSSVTIEAIASTGEVPVLSASRLAPNVIFRDNDDGTGELTISPTIENIGACTCIVVAQTEFVLDSTIIELKAVNNPSSLKPLIPMALQNRWVYQSLSNRLDLDTVKVDQMYYDDDRPFWIASFYPTIGMLEGEVRIKRDTVASLILGPQFFYPTRLPESYETRTHAICYSITITREIEWIAGSVEVPAGRFAGCLKFSGIYRSRCWDDSEIVHVEEIIIAPGVGIISIAQIRSATCSGVCSSRWELLSYSLH